MLWLRISWYYLMLRFYEPEIFILCCAMLFMVLGMLLLQEWQKWKKRHEGYLQEPIEIEDSKTLIAKFDLTEREYEVLLLLAEGKSNQEIAEKIHVSESTVKYHLGLVYRRLGVKRRIQAMAVVRKNNPYTLV